MNIRCLIVDDEPLAIQLLQKHIAQLPFFEVSAVCSNAIEALGILKHQPVDLLFLDVRMPQLTGLDLLKSLRNPPHTILTTAYREYALDAFDLDVVDYLLKPVTFDRFFRSVERYLQHQPQTRVLSSSEPQFIYLKSGYTYFKLDLQEILFVESRKDYIRVVTKDRTIVSKYKLIDMEKELEGKGFLRIHRSYIVNLQHITSFTAADIDVPGHQLPIGDSYKALVTATIMR
jgi:two-component system LytT family response regulator